MFGGDNQEMYSDSPSASNVSPLEKNVSPLENNNPDGQNSPFPGDNMQNEMPQHADTVIKISKQLKDDLKKLRRKIKDHKKNIKLLKHQNNKLDSSIIEMEVAIGKNLTTSSSNPEPIQNITNGTQVSSDHFLVKDVVGIVASLGKVEDPNLSRLLSKYLGQETMLAVVCKSHEGLKSLELYFRDGSANEGLGIHSFAESVGISSLVGPLNTICIDHLSPYTGKFVGDDPQRRLDLIKPEVTNGETPPGFLGFAVNMIMIDDDNLKFVSKYGHGLRETLFYNLFSSMQVYKSREDMKKAAPLITSGAISLDGEMMRSPGVFTKGHLRDIDVKFPVKNFSLPPTNLEIKNLLKEAKWKKDACLEDLEREQQLLDNVKFRYKAKRESAQFVAKNPSFAVNQVAP